VTARRLPVFVVALGLLGSQAGHLLAYQLRFGAAATQLQSSGAHAYFPVVAKTGLGIAAALILSALLVMGAANIVSHRGFRPEPSTQTYLSLLAALYTLQLACFAGQETVEAVLAGAPTTSPGALLLWGTLGQLPLAAVAALAVRWLVAEFKAAIKEIRAALELVERRPELVPTVVLVSAPRDEPLLPSFLAGHWQSKRGPPSFCVSAP
jgi:hypothetical protein